MTNIDGIGSFRSDESYADVALVVGNDARTLVGSRSLNE